MPKLNLEIGKIKNPIGTPKDNLDLLILTRTGENTMIKERRDSLIKKGVYYITKLMKVTSNFMNQNLLKLSPVITKVTTKIFTKVRGKTKCI